MAAKPLMMRSVSFTSTNSPDISTLSFRSPIPERNFYADYKLGKDIIGYGTHGEVRTCVHIQTDRLFAVKLINKASLPAEVIRHRLIQKQFNLILSLNHPSILKLYEFYEDRGNYFIVMEYVQGGDLFEKLKKVQYFTETAAARIMKQILSAIAHMHSKGIAHRDIKPENIMIEEKQGDIVVKIIDFDTAIPFQGKVLKDKQGSSYYLAPEVIKGEYNEKCDVWSAGITMYVLLTNTFPFATEDSDEVEIAILDGKLDLDYLREEGISNEAISLLCKTLDKNIDSRFSAYDASNHGWILRHSYDPLPRPSASRDYNVLSHALKLWSLKFLLPSSELSPFHLAFVQTDCNSDGFLQPDELQAYLGSTSPLDVSCLIEQGRWSSTNCLDIYEFASVMASKPFWRKHADAICNEFDWGLDDSLPTTKLVDFLQSQLKGDRFKGAELPPKTTRAELLGLLYN
jgi:calcium-dependent protein kinase